MPPVAQFGWQVLMLSVPVPTAAAVPHDDQVMFVTETPPSAQVRKTVVGRTTEDVGPPAHGGIPGKVGAVLAGMTSVTVSVHAAVSESVTSDTSTAARRFLWSIRPFTLP